VVTTNSCSTRQKRLSSAEESNVVETQVYQAILERHPAQIVPRLKEIVANPDPALGYTNGELRFWLGWAQEVGGEHADITFCRFQISELTRRGSRLSGKKKCSCTCNTRKVHAAPQNT
jgi:hypothetical protein